MKKQLIIAAIACAVSGAAFALPNGASTQGINIGLHVEPTLPELAITFSNLNPTIDFETEAVTQLGGQGGYPKLITHDLGTVKVDAVNIPTTTNRTHARISVESNNGWKLLGPNGEETPYALFDGNPNSGAGANPLNISTNVIPDLPITSNPAGLGVLGEIHYSKNWYVRLSTAQPLTDGEHTDLVTITTTYEQSAAI